MLKNRRGQGAVEFTLCIMLLLVIAWIPADFGLAFYSAQLAANASRDGARIASADAAIATQVGSCTVRVDCNAVTGSVMDMVSKRIGSALLPDATVTVALPPGAPCNQKVRVTVSGTYYYYFYRLLQYFGADVPAGTTIARQTEMRWEHQC